MPRKPELFTVVTPIPGYIPRQLAIDILHSHDEVLTLSPLVLEHRPIPAPRTATTDEYYSTWYEIVERVQYVPWVGKVGSGKITFHGCFHDMPWGLQTHIYAPMNVDLRHQYRISGNHPSVEAPETRETGLDALGAPADGLYLREDIEVKCNNAMVSSIKSQLEYASKEMVQRIIKKADSKQGNIRYGAESSGNSAMPQASTTWPVADAQTTIAGTDARAEAYRPPAAASQAPSMVLPVESPANQPLSTESQERQAHAMSTSQRLWHAAYESLEKGNDTAQLVESYLKTLTTVLGTSAHDSRGPADLNDPRRRQDLMKKLVQAGLARIATSSKIRKGVGDVAQYILSAKAMVDLAIQNIPQAALPWAGVCIGLQIILNPAKATNSNLAGLTHVISRMDWYCALTDHLLKEGSINAKDNAYKALVQQLEEKVVALYKALLLYQMRSVCSYYRHRGYSFLRDIVNVDDWDAELMNIKAAEESLRTDSDQYNKLREKDALSALLESAEGMEASLGDIHQSLQDFVSLQKAIRSDDIDAACQKHLRVVDPQHDMERIERSKDELIEDATNWIFRTEEYAAFTNWYDGGPEYSLCRLLWIRGHVGTGKTMLMIGIIRELSRQPAALAPSLSYFFCQGTDTALSNATAVLRSLMWLLIIQQPCLASHLRQRYNESGVNLFNDRNAFYALSEVFRGMLEDTDLSPVYFAVDALDECREGQVDLMEFISTSLTLSDKVKWIVSSHPTIKIKAPGTASSLVELDAQRLEDPVRVYISHKLSGLRSRKGYTDTVLRKVSGELHRRAENSFLWVALVFKMLDSEYGWNAADILKKMPPGLPKLYERMMSSIEGGTMDWQCCKDVLVATSLAYRPLSLSELGVLAGVEPGIDLHTIVDECGSFLMTRGEKVCLIHQSAKDYLDEAFKPRLRTAGHALGHANIGRRSIEAISSRLRRNIYNLDYGIKPNDMSPPQPDPLASVRYSCVFWADHLLSTQSLECGRELVQSGEVLDFLQEHFLHWLESLSLIGQLSDGVMSMKRLLRVAQESGACPGLAAFLEDAEKFVRSYGSIIERAPLQTFGSALVFCPTKSAVKSAQWQNRLPFIQAVAGIKEHWDAHSQTLEGHGREVRAVIFSPDGEVLASASGDGTVRLWVAATGTCRWTTEGDGEHIYAADFSPDSKVLAAASDDGTVRLWDAVTGSHWRTLEGHSRSVNAVAFTPDGKTVASASGDCTVRLWDAVTGSHWRTLEGHSRSVNAVAFTPDGKTVASASGDCTVRLWDAVTGSHWRTLEGHSRSVNAVAFTPDGKTVASASSDSTVQLWDTATGAHQWTLKGHDSWINAVVFSQDGRIVASASYDCTVRLWDTATGTLCQTLEGHTSSVNTVAFSPDGKVVASASGDSTVRLWDATTGPQQQTFEGHTGSVNTVAFSLDGSMVASASCDCTIRLWDAATWSYLRTLEGHSSSVRAVAFSPDSKTLASASDDSTVRLWDAANGVHQRTLEGHSGVVMAAAFSPDGRIVASISSDRTIRLWDTATGVHRRTLQRYSSEANAITFSPDGKKVLLTSEGHYDQVWDVATGQYQQIREDLEEYHSDPTLYVGKEWISMNGRNILWLPMDYRPTSVALCGNMIALGQRSGGLTFLKLDLDELL